MSLVNIFVDAFKKAANRKPDAKEEARAEGLLGPTTGDADFTPIESQAQPGDPRLGGSGSKVEGVDTIASSDPEEGGEVAASAPPVAADPQEGGEIAGGVREASASADVVSAAEGPAGSGDTPGVSRFDGIAESSGPEHDSQLPTEGMQPAEAGGEITPRAEGTDPFKIEIEDVTPTSALPPSSPSPVPVPYPNDPEIAPPDGDTGGVMAKEDAYQKLQDYKKLEELRKLEEFQKLEDYQKLQTIKMEAPGGTGEPPTDPRAEDGGLDALARKAGEGQKDFLEFKMDDAMVSSYSVSSGSSGAGDAAPGDTPGSSTLIDLDAEADAGLLGGGGVGAGLDIPDLDVDPDTDDLDI